MRRLIFELLASTVGKPFATKLASGNPLVVIACLIVGAAVGVYLGYRTYHSVPAIDKELYEIAPFIFGIIGAFVGAIIGAFLPIGRRPPPDDSAPRT
jgi:uncharacterized membrane protein YeaQ/YmgE (transglycosylase-associated protein family)